MSRAVPSRTRACTIGCLVLSWRSVGASRRSIICRLSSSLVGTVSPRKCPDASRYETRAPSRKISSTSRRAMRSVIGPKSVIDRSTRSTMTDGDTSGSSSPSRARRSYSSTARCTSTRTSSRSPSGRSCRRSIRARTSRRIPSYASTVMRHVRLMRSRSRRCAPGRLGPASLRPGVPGSRPLGSGGAPAVPRVQGGRRAERRSARARPRRW